MYEIKANSIGYKSNILWKTPQFCFSIFRRYFKIKNFNDVCAHYLNKSKILYYLINCKKTFK